MKRLAVVQWHPQDELAKVTSEVWRELGVEVQTLAHDARVPEGPDAVFVIGPYGSLMPLALQLAERPVKERPALLLWQTEQFWNPALPTAAGRTLGIARATWERALYARDGEGRWRIGRARAALTHKGYRFRYFGDLVWLQAQGLLTVLAVPSDVIAAFLNERGVRAMVAYIGTPPSWGEDLQLERDIPVLWFGKPGSARRAKLLERLTDELEGRGVALMRCDGVHAPYIFGAERTRLLNRTRVVVNFMRQPHDSNAMRYFIVAPNRAMIVSEPTLPHTPFVPGEHLVHAPPAQLAETICRYVADERARNEIAERAHTLVSTELTMHKMLARVFRAWQQADP